MYIQSLPQKDPDALLKCTTVLLHFSVVFKTIVLTSSFNCAFGYYAFTSGLPQASLVGPMSKCSFYILIIVKVKFFS